MFPKWRNVPMARQSRRKKRSRKDEELAKLKQIEKTKAEEALLASTSSVLFPGQKPTEAA